MKPAYTIFKKSPTDYILYLTGREPMHFGDLRSIFAYLETLEKASGDA